MPGLSFMYRAGKKLLRRVPAPLLRFRPFEVFAIPLQSSGVVPLPALLRRRASGESLECQVRWVANTADAELLRRLASRENLDALNFATRRVAAAWFHGEPIACAWIATKTFEEAELGLQFELRPTDAWLFAAVVIQNHRDRGVYSQLLTFLIDELRREGMHRILLGVTFGNEPSRRAHLRQGAVKIGEITAARCLGFSICRCGGKLRLLSPRGFAWRRQFVLDVKG